MASILELPTTQVEHWFRTDRYFAIPDPDIWPTLKHLLGIQTEEFDDAITQFVDKPGIFEQSQRLYLIEGIAPTIMAGQPQTVIVNDKDKASN